MQNLPGSSVFLVEWGLEVCNQPYFLPWPCFPILLDVSHSLVVLLLPLRAIPMVTAADKYNGVGELSCLGNPQRVPASSLAFPVCWYRILGKRSSE